MPPAALQLPAAMLQGRFVRLEPYTELHKADVRAALDCDAEAWDLFSLSGHGEHFEAWWAHHLRAMKGGGWIAFAVRDLASGRIVGSTSFLNIKPEWQSAEIGATFLHPSVRSGMVNPEAKLLMLQHAFAHGARRVTLLTDARNVRSQAAIAKLGAVREGVLRRERVIWTGHVRDSVIFSITDLDWPTVQAGLQARLATR
jgi:N-acetyltransferase